MSSETRFSLSHSGFWNALLPMGEAYIRAQNSEPNRFVQIHQSMVPADQRGVINEAAFLLFSVAAMEKSTRPILLDPSVANRALDQAYEYVSQLRQYSESPPQVISNIGKSDALALAERLFSFFSKAGSVTIKPFFRGCCWLNAAEGDVLVGRTLFEIKAGERQFRLSDIRQLLCYCALDFSASRMALSRFHL